MGVYVGDIAYAAVLFPFAAALLTLPYLVHQYRKLGSVPWINTLIVYSFVFYLMCAYFLVLLPLPADRSIVVAYAQTPQLVPFNFVREILSETHISASDPSTWLAALRTPSVYEAIFNTLLLVPLGVYLRYYFRRKWWQTLIIGFLVTLSFETTQLTGIWGIYEHPYRLFDVDDLMLNTMGAMLGFWLVGPVMRILPSMDEVSAEARVRGLRASATRRALSFLIDVAIVIAATVGASAVAGFPLLACLVSCGAIVFSLVPLLTRGKTPGQALLRLRIVRPDASPAKWFQVIARYGLLFVFAALAPVVLLLAANALVNDISAGDAAVAEAFVEAHAAQFAEVFCGLLALWVVTLIVRAVYSAVRGRGFVMLNGLLSGTRVMTDSGIAKARAVSDPLQPQQSLQQSQQVAGTPTPPPE